MLTISQLTYSYGDSLIFHRAGFSAPKGEITAVLGVSGIGKTTLFKLICGTLQPLEGSIFWNDSPADSSLISYMQQKEILLPWRTVRENISLVNELAPIQKDSLSIEESILEISKTLEIDTVLDKYPSQLSGGMKQRVELARCILADRPILLLDEPFSSLDPLIKSTLYKELTTIASERQKTIILITHDIYEALHLANTLYVIRNKTIHPIQVDSLTSLYKESTYQNLIDLFFIKHEG